MKNLARHLAIPIVLSLVASAIGLALYFLPLGTLPIVNRVADYSFMNDVWIRGYESGAYQTLHIPAQNVDEQNDQLRLLKIDEESIGNTQAGLGTFPWPRSVYGRIIAKLRAAGAKAVAFDIDFLDAPPNPADDVAFAKGMDLLPTVTPFVLNTTSGGQLGIEPVDPVIAPHLAKTGYSTVQFAGGMLINQPLAIFTSVRNQNFVSFAEASIEAYTGKPVKSVSAGEGSFAGKRIPLEDGTLFLLPFRDLNNQDIGAVAGTNGAARAGAAESAPTFVQDLSLADALNESDSDLRVFVQGRMVMVGATAEALGDFVTTPFGHFAGVYTNLRFMDQLLNGKYIVPAGTLPSILLLIFLPLILTLIIARPKAAVRGAIVSLGLIVVYAAITTTVYSVSLLWINTLQVATAMFLATLFVSINQIARENADRRMVTNLFGMHVSPAIVNDILSHEDPRNALALKGKKVKATIFYSDIRGFTAMSETMTPEDIYNQLNEYFEEMCAIIFEYGGYVDKFIGDCVMAVFSAPYQTPNDAKNAVLAAVAQQKKILELAEKWQAQGKRPFTVGMGVNTGDVVMGNLGASSRMNYTVIGDNVNLAARLYNVAKAGEIIISDYTYQEVKDLVVAEDREPVLVKGKKDPISIYNITDVKAEASTNGAVTPQPATA